MNRYAIRIATRWLFNRLTKLSYAAFAEKRLKSPLRPLKAVIRCELVPTMLEYCYRNQISCQLTLKKPKSIRFPLRCIHDAILVHATPIVEKWIPFAATSMHCLGQHNRDQHDAPSNAVFTHFTRS